MDLNISDKIIFYVLPLLNEADRLRVRTSRLTCRQLGELEFHVPIQFKAKYNFAQEEGYESDGADDGGDVAVVDNVDLDVVELTIVDHFFQLDILGRLLTADELNAPVQAHRRGARRPLRIASPIEKLRRAKLRYDTQRKVEVIQK